MSDTRDPGNDAHAEASNEQSVGAQHEEEIDPGWPWSFLLLVAAGALYLIFRFVELGIELFN